MPGIREVLQFVLEADASGAVKGFESVAKASDKHLGDSEKSATNLGSTLTKVGAVATGAGIAMAAGLVATVKSFEKAEASANKLDTAVSGMGSNIDTKQIKDLAFQLQQVSTATDNQIVSAARWGAVYGLSTDQLKTLLRAAVDLSAQTGQSIDATTKALARAASGGSDKVLVKWGLQLDETARKADAFGTTMAASMDFAGGAAAKEADTFSGQLTRMGNNWTDVKEKIGAGANEVFEPMARGAANLSEKVAALNPDLLKTAGHFAAIGSMATTAFGGLASLGGQLVNIRDGFSGIGSMANKAFSGVGLPLKDAEGNATKLGGALGGAAKAAGLMVAALAVSDAVFGGLNTATDNTQHFTDAMNDFVGKSKDASMSSRTLSKDFAQMAQEQDKSLKMSHLWTDFGADIETTFDGAKTHIEDTQAALDSLDPESASKALDALQDVTNALAKGSDQRKTNQEFIDKNRKSLDLETKAASESGKATVAQAQSAKEAADELKAWDDSLRNVNGALGLYAIGAKLAADASDGFGTAVEAMDTDEQVTSALALGDAFHGVEGSIKNLPRSFDETKAALGGYNEEQSKALKAVTDWGDAAKGQIQTLIQSGATNEEVAAKAGTYRDALTGVMKQAGMTTQQIDAYLKMLGLTPEDVNTALKLSGDEKAKFQLQLYHNDLVNLTADQDTFVRALIAQGEYASAVKAMDEFKKPVTAPVNVKFNYPKDFMGPIPPGATRGPQMVAPAGMTATARGVPVPAVMAIPAPNITITLPAGTTPATTLSAIRRYQRLGGDMGGLLDTVAAIR